MHLVTKYVFTWNKGIFTISVGCGNKVLMLRKRQTFKIQIYAVYRTQRWAKPKKRRERDALTSITNLQSVYHFACADCVCSSIYSENRVIVPVRHSNSSNSTRNTRFSKVQDAPSIFVPLLVAGCKWPASTCPQIVSSLVRIPSHLLSLTTSTNLFRRC